jgi:hypothetical protein
MRDDQDLFGTVTDLTGKITHIPFHDLVNPLGLPLRIVPPLSGRWHLIYEKKKKTITLWPHLVAAGNMSGKPSSVESATEKRPWEPPHFSTDPSKVGHIFRNELGHLSEDTEENRTLILQAVSKPENLVGVNKFGREYYVQTFPNGTQSWALIDQNHLIVNGGFNRFVIKCERDLNPNNPLGWKFIPVKYSLAKPNETDFKIRIAINRLFKDPSFFEKQQAAAKSL